MRPHGDGWLLGLVTWGWEPEERFRNDMKLSWTNTHKVEHWMMVSIHG